MIGNTEDAARKILKIPMNYLLNGVIEWNEVDKTPYEQNIWNSYYDTFISIEQRDLRGGSFIRSNEDRYTFENEEYRTVFKIRLTKNGGEVIEFPYCTNLSLSDSDLRNFSFLYTTSDLQENNIVGGATVWSQEHIISSGEIQSEYIEVTSITIMVYDRPIIDHVYAGGEYFYFVWPELETLSSKKVPLDEGIFNFLNFAQGDIDRLSNSGYKIKVDNENKDIYELVETDTRFYHYKVPHNNKKNFYIKNINNVIEYVPYQSNNNLYYPFLGQDICTELKNNDYYSFLTKKGTKSIFNLGNASNSPIKINCCPYIKYKPKDPIYFWGKHLIEELDNSIIQIGQNLSPSDKNFNIPIDTAILDIQAAGGSNETVRTSFYGPGCTGAGGGGFLRLISKVNNNPIIIQRKEAPNTYGYISLTNIDWKINNTPIEIKVWEGTIGGQNRNGKGGIVEYTTNSLTNVNEIYLLFSNNDYSFPYSEKITIAYPAPWDGTIPCELVYTDRDRNGNSGAFLYSNDLHTSTYVPVNGEGLIFLQEKGILSLEKYKEWYSSLSKTQRQVDIYPKNNENSSTWENSSFEYKISSIKKDDCFLIYNGFGGGQYNTSWKINKEFFDDQFFNWQESSNQKFAWKITPFEKDFFKASINNLYPFSTLEDIPGGCGGKGSDSYTSGLPGQTLPSKKELGISSYRGNGGATGRSNNKLKLYGGGGGGGSALGKGTKGFDYIPRPESLEGYGGGGGGGSTHDYGGPGGPSCLIIYY